MERVRDREKFGMALEFLPIRKGVERRVDDDDGMMRRPSLLIVDLRCLRCGWTLGE